MNLETLIAELEVAANMEQLRTAMNRGIAELDFSGYLFLNRGVYELTPQSREHVILSCIAGQSVDLYCNSMLPWFDAIVTRAAEQHLPFFWITTDLLRGPDDDPDLVLPSPLRRYGIDIEVSYGWTVPVHDATGRISVMSFTGSRDFDHFKRTIETHRATLHAMAVYFHAYVNKAASLRAEAPAFELTPRERQCLEWAARGKSRSDIGQIIGLSPRTVKFHLENAQRKLNVARTTQAVLRAASLRLIAVLD